MTSPRPHEPFVSIVVPTSGRAAVLAGCLEGLVSQGYPSASYEVVVVENGPPDGTADVVRSLAGVTGRPRIRHVHRRARDANAARNAGAAASSGDPLCFVDDDVLVPEGWLSELVAGALRNGSAGCVGGPIRALLDGSPPRTCDEHQLAGIAFGEDAAEAEVREVWGGNMAVRRSALAAVGPFREGLRRHQDWEWEQRLLRSGGKIVLVPGAWLWHRQGTADLHVPRLMREFFLRGYTKASLGFPVDARWTARRARRNLAHGMRERCTRGLTEAARDAGLLWASLLRRGGGS